MGQQQLFMIVLGIVVVALAVMSGFLLFEDNFKKNNAEALVADGINIAITAQAWKSRPPTFGGQIGAPRANPMDYSGFSLPSIALENPHVTLNGAFTVTADSRGLVIVGQNEEFRNRVTLTVSGLTEKDIVAVISQMDETYTATDK